MKHLFTLLFCLSVLAVQAQDAMYPSDYLEKTGTATAAQPFKKANTILLQTGLTQEEAFKTWGQFLLGKGFALDNTNNDFYTLSTKPKDASRLNYAYVLHATILPDGTVQLRAEWQQKVSIVAGSRASGFYAWTYKGPRDVLSSDLVQLVTAAQYPVQYAVR